MSDRLRFSLLVLTLAAAFGLRAAGALAAPAAPLHPAPAVHAESTRAMQSVALHAHIVQYARRFLGVPYRYGGSSPAGGFDCSGFVRFVYAHFGLALPHYSVAQFSLGHRVVRAGLKPGDLVFFNGLGHVGMYVGEGSFIHAPHSGTRVSIEPLSAHSGFVGARRLL